MGSSNLSNQHNTTGSSCVVRSAAEKASGKKICRAVVGLGLSGYSVHVEAHLRAAGWELHAEPNPELARQYAIHQKAQLVILPLMRDAHGSVLLTTKIVMAMPRKSRIVLVADNLDADVLRLAAVTGAAVVTEAQGVSALLAAIVSPKTCENQSV